MTDANCWTTECCRSEEDAAENGHLRCMEAAHSRGFVFSIVAMGFAARYERENCVRFLIRVGCPIPPCATEYAAAHGNLHMLEILIVHGAPYCGDTLAAAAESGRENCVRYLLELKNQWPEYVLWGATLNDNVEIVKILHYCNKISWGRLTLNYAEHSRGNLCKDFLNAIHDDISGELKHARDSVSECKNIKRIRIH